MFTLLIHHLVLIMSITFLGTPVLLFIAHGVILVGGKRSIIDIIKNFSLPLVAFIYVALYISGLQEIVMQIMFQGKSILIDYNMLTIVGVIGLLGCLYGEYITRKTFGGRKKLLGVDQKEGNTEIVIINTGIYGVVRHPRYIGYMLLRLSRALIFQTPFFGYFLSYQIISRIIASKLEEQELLQRIGNRYKEHMQQVKSFYFF